MSDQFFALPQEEQDGLIRAGFRVFALDGFRNASLARVEEEAGKEPGFLSPYFSDKKDFYAFLYGYAVRMITLELNTQVKDPSIDCFDLEKEILSVETDLMKNYPALFLFLEAVRNDSDGDALLTLSDTDVSIPDTYEALRAKSERSAYVRIEQKQGFSRIIDYIKAGVMREVLADPALSHLDYWERMNGYLELLRGLALAL